MSGRRSAWLDAFLYGGSALVATAIAIGDSIPLLAEWGRRANAPYALGALGASLLALGWFQVPSHLRTTARAAILGLVFVGAVLVPLAMNISARAREPEPHAQSETLVTEEAAGALLRGENPYVASYEDGPLGRWPSENWIHLPYLPGIVLFGLPHAMDWSLPLADARVIFLIASVTAGVLALRLSNAPAERLLAVAAVLLVLPTGARSIVGGGDDISVLALMLLALVLSARSHPVAAGATLGLAAAIKQTAWPLLPFLIVAARDGTGRPMVGRVLTGFGAVVVPLVLPFLVWDPTAFVQDTVLYPLGLTEDRTLAGSPTIGHVLTSAFPSARVPIFALLAASVVAVGVFLLVRRPPNDAGGAAERTALLFTVAVLLATAGRFGYLIYPLNLLVWSRLLLRPIEAAQEEPSRRRAYATASSTDISPPSARSFS